MKSLLTWRDHSYFKEREGHQFLVNIIQPRICRLTIYKSAYWFEYPGIHTKAISTPCASLNDLKGTKIQYKGYPLAKGKIGGWGITNSPWLYIFWGQIPMTDGQGNKIGFPCALPDNFHLELQP